MSDEDGVVLWRVDADEHFGFPSHVHTDLTPSMLERLEAIEARQRAFKVHDPTCPEAPYNDENRQHWRDDGSAAGPCDCWLSR